MKIRDIEERDERNDIIDEFWLHTHKTKIEYNKDWDELMYVINI